MKRTVSKVDSILSKFESFSYQISNEFRLFISFLSLLLLIEIGKGENLFLSATSNKEINSKNILRLLFNFDRADFFLRRSFYFEKPEFISFRLT